MNEVSVVRAMSRWGNRQKDKKKSPCPSHTNCEQGFLYGSPFISTLGSGFRCLIMTKSVVGPKYQLNIAFIVLNKHLFSSTYL